MNFNDFIKAIGNLGIVVSEDMKQQFLHYKKLIQEVNQVMNLTAIDDDEGIYLKHFWDSLLIAQILEKNSTVCDVGSGAGFPGIVLAIARPDLSVTCVEPTGKRCDFLNRVIDECQLSNVRVVNDRAENFVKDQRETFDIVTARAVAYLDILAELCVPLAKVNGKFIAMKGARGKEEYQASKRALDKLMVELRKENEEFHDDLGLRYNLEFYKYAKTPSQYPRDYAKIKRRPLSGRKHG